MGNGFIGLTGRVFIGLTWVIGFGFYPNPIKEPQQQQRHLAVAVRLRGPGGQLRWPAAPEDLPAAAAVWPADRERDKERGGGQ